MSRSKDGGLWRMYCDQPGCHTFSEGAAAPPPLELFRDRGWFIGRLTDTCPACLAEGVTPKSLPYDFEAAAARRAARAGIREANR